jgi:endonuclease/exonuclease/phosphatase family metal-dependent hydrolase
MPRVAVEAVVETPFGPIRVITTHLEYYSGRQRAAQVERLRDLHAEAMEENATGGEGAFRQLARPASAIVCGDFNMPPDDPLRARLLESGLVDAWQALNAGKPHPPTFRVNEPASGEAPYCCDYVFVSKDLAPRLRAIRVDAQTRASDHQPVIIDLE